MDCLMTRCKDYNEKTLWSCKKHTDAMLECKDYLTTKKDADALFFMKRRLPHLLSIAEELLTWCIEPDKKGIWKDDLKKYRKEYEAIMEKA